MTTLEFNMLDHVEKLTPSKGGKFICPVCGGNDLSISKTGAYKCWSGLCESEAIREAVSPSNSKKGRSPRNSHRATNRPPSKKDLDSQALLDEITIDNQLTEYASMVADKSMTVSEALLALSTWCKAHKHNIFSAQKLLQEKIKKYKAAAPGGDDDEKSRMLREYELIKKRFGDQFRWNELFKQVELDGEKFAIGLSKPFFNIIQRMNLKSGRDDIADIVLMYARENSYNPVTEYLDRCFIQHGASTDILKSIAKRYLGTESPIHQILLVKWLISAVARAYQPGCKCDNALILQGSQGLLKSTFFEVLAGSAWFDDTMGSSSDKDERLKLHRAWIVEWAELETIFKKKEVAAVKSFMTTKNDILRPPYGRDIEALPRPSIFCGTTNPKQFLTDSTGNRRFWVIPVEKTIDRMQLERERDQIWGAVIKLYRDGCMWYLTEEEDATLNEARSEFETSDSWNDEIADFIEGKDMVSVQEILDELFKLPIAQHDPKIQGRVRVALTKLNWKASPKTVWHKGKSCKVWNKV